MSEVGQYGFSLLELAAVLGIVAVLALIAVPYSQANQRAQLRLAFIDEFTALVSRQPTRDCQVRFDEVLLPADNPQYRVVRACRGSHWTLCASRRQDHAEGAYCLDHTGRRYIDTNHDFKFQKGYDKYWRN